MAEPYKIRSQHEAIQKLYLPIFTHLETISVHWKSICMGNYAKKSNQIFHPVLLDHNQKTNQALEKCCHDVTQVVNKEVATIFSTHKIPTIYIGRLKQSFNYQIENVINKIEGNNTFILVL